MSGGVSVSGVLRALRAQPAKSAGAGRALMVIAARRGEGATTGARAIANAAGPGAVYAIDLDLHRNGLARSFAGEESAILGPRIDGKLNGAHFFDLVDGRGRVAVCAGCYHFHRVGRTRVFAGVFDGRAAPQGARARINDDARYWDAARAGGAHVIVDAPALERSAIGLRIARHMDGVVLVVGAGAGGVPAALAAKEELADAGANLIGLVYAGASEPALTFERVLRQAG